MTSATTAAEWPFISHNLAAQCRYEIMREDGVSHNLAEMFALQEFCGVETETTFNQGVDETDGFDMDTSFDRALFKKYKQIAKDAGMSTGSRKYYAEVAQYPGDPRAWVASKDDVKNRLRDLGWAARGGNVDCDFRGDIIDDEKSQIDPKLVADHTNQELMRIHEDQVPSGKVTVTKKEYDKVYADQHTQMNKGYE